MKDIFSLVVDARSLFVHHIVVFQEMLSYGKILPFHLLLGSLDGSAHHFVFDGNSLCHANPGHQT